MAGVLEGMSTRYKCVMGTCLWQVCVFWAMSAEQKCVVANDGFVNQAGVCCGGCQPGISVLWGMSARHKCVVGDVSQA